ncbi:MAG: protein of unknown function DUF445 [uncultured Frankineae bacterium]|uniref:Membrane protein STY4873 n=1 Tax=uncultured Frankineae bacterium TaxID=437475 RepID=A0A6J4M388_9ACTN|nr:MAG: protein of unknown function DUF445 [uncultured Frankineae bacterium]
MTPAPAASLHLPSLLGADVTGLRRMKRRATGLLVLAALVFLGSFALPDTTATGYLRAAAEAGMIGGLADWFAVTALFRHPLGLRIPHTALVPRKKDELATKLGEFVTGNFLTPDAVAAQLAEARLVPRTAERLAEPETARRVGVELSTAVAAALDALDARALTDSVLELARRDLDRRSYTPVLGQFLARAVEGQGQTPLVDVCVTRLRMHLVHERDTLRPLLKGYLEAQGSLFWLFTTDARVDTLLLRAVELLGEVEQDPGHPARRWLDGLLASLADDLRYNAETARRVDARLRALVEDPHLQSLLHAVLVDVAASVRASLDDLDGGLQARLAALVGGAARRVLDDEALQTRIEERLQSAVRYAVAHYGGTVVALISRTVQGWEARDASARIEAAVGRDLQFIRINGTVVGALAGLALHAVAELVG